MAYRTGRWTPRLECLGERALPSVTFTEADDGSLEIRSDQRADSIVVTDDGTGTILVEVAGQDPYTSEAPITTIRIFGASGADDVEYNLTGDLSSERTVEVFLGNQHDSFAANVDGALLEGADLSILANGGNGHDSLTLNGASANVDAGANLSVEFNGNNGKDALLLNYAAAFMGTASFLANGGNGKDSVGGEVTVLPSETETGESTPSTGALTVEFNGGNGKDDMSLSVDVADGTTTDDLSVFEATVDGGRGKDTFDTTVNVDVVDAPSV
jgi:hypothetical protein